jgi:RNA polymerase sigma-70 factor (ECF subfamily)
MMTPGAIRVAMTDLNNFDVFMRNYQDMVYSVAVRLLGSDADAQDIAQTVFLKAYEHFDQLASNPAAAGWLKTVATNLSLNHLTRYRARWRLFSEMRPEDDGRDFVEDQPAPDTLEQTVASGDDRQMLEAALRKLPAAQRVPLVLFHFEDLGYEEIAAKLNVSLAKVKTDIHRGRRALRKVLLAWHGRPVEPDRPRNTAADSSSQPQRTDRRALLGGTLAALTSRVAKGFTRHAPRITPHGA